MNKYFTNYVRYFQPIMSSKDGSVHHYEMLLRKTDGSTAFHDIQEMERNGEVPQLDLANVSFAINKVNKNSTSKPIAVNVSSSSLMNDNFFNALCNELRACKNKSLISIELTETGHSPDIPKLREYFEILQDAGIKISADDFSSGFMDEKVVKSLPFNNIKIDRNLVQGMMSSNDDLQRVKDIISYAKQNDITVTAEFVDSQEILEAVRGLGIDYAQGFYLAEPSPNMKNTNDSGYTI
ncbi:EAL domain-containing protein [Vibrio parahaemolyticus]|uniref:EAL domain-containing protein n=1 Tax=Vibrio parahaemolyticus TaxID=670 RepID=UPI001A19154F|nr:EAL domain-containing protein [Vibrio parahaemolyticus]EGR3229077.1 EAL domain-containing protein [Vibrio parahaemolyticus]EJG0181153.1 EAL domain-containing protein [Vibrio parahaemolyticus]MCS0116570.1 EAL domain-containing protein [Vibrio parahaemolyticus]